jgi:hypothetical protein
MGLIGIFSNDIDISDDEVLKPDLAPKSQMMSNNVITMTKDYKLKVNGKVVDQWDDETIRVAEGYKLSLHNLYEENAGLNNGYLWASNSKIHIELGKWMKQAGLDLLVSEGFTGIIDDLNAVAHLDDNTFNVKLSNLMNLPSQWNKAFAKPKEAKRAGEKLYTQFRINGSDQYSTVVVETEEETLVQRDILLIKHCKEHITISPDLAQVYIFRYGLVRPAKYVALGWYNSIQSLLSHYGDWVKDNRGSSNKRTKYVIKPGRFRIADPVEYTEASKQAITLSVPMDETFVSFEYCGRNGKVIQRLCNKDFYEAVVVPYRDLKLNTMLFLYQRNESCLFLVKSSKCQRLVISLGYLSDILLFLHLYILRCLLLQKNYESTESSGSGAAKTTEFCKSMEKLETTSSKFFSSIFY